MKQQSTKPYAVKNKQEVKNIPKQRRYSKTVDGNN